MKYLSEYMEARQTAAFTKAGAFFAFSTKQYDEQARLGVKYTQMGSGMICPALNAVWLAKELDTIYRESIAQDLAENGANAIIIRELNNHEAYYTGDIESTVEALSDYPYPVTIENIQKVFKDKTHDPDYEPNNTVCDACQ